MSYEIIIGEILAATCIIYATHLFRDVFVKNKLLESERKLRSRIANFEANYGEIREKTPGIIGSALGDLGIESIMGELGIDPGILNNPMVRGLIKSYAPKILDQIQKKTEGSTQNQPFL
jgi:hypothetical protein